MPYILKEDRDALDYAIFDITARILAKDGTAGRMNYCISSMINMMIEKKGLSYSNVNEIIGALECIKLELYRRVAAPYEDLKIEENGDVYFENNNS
jgi:hypothetical protein